MSVILALVDAVTSCRRSSVALPVWTGANAGGDLEPLPARSPGCQRAGDALTGIIERTVRVAGYDRRYSIVVPRGSGAPRPLPVIVYFEGRTSMDWPPPPGRKIAGGLALLPELARAAILVIPRGTPFPKERVIGWYVGCPSDDVDLFDAMLREIGDSHCIDPRAVFVAGFSWGAEMAQAVACCRGEKIRAVALASGSDLAVIPRCPAPRLPAVRATYAAGGDGAYSKEEFTASVAFFRKAQGCAAEADPVDPRPCVSYRSCAQPVIACPYPGLGHAFPTDFAETTWAFFSKQRPP